MSAASRQAPAVAVTCTGGGAWRAAQAVLAGLAVLAVGLWALLHRSAPVWPAFAAAALVAALAWRAAQPRPALLRWDGTGWSLDGDAGTVRVMIDLGGWLLLRFTIGTGRAARWLPLPDGDAGAARHALRAALYARAPAPGQPAARTAAPD